MRVKGDTYKSYLKASQFNALEIRSNLLDAKTSKIETISSTIGPGYYNINSRSLENPQSFTISRNRAQTSSLVPSNSMTDRRKEYQEFEVKNKVHQREM